MNKEKTLKKISDRIIEISTNGVDANFSLIAEYCTIIELIEVLNDKQLDAVSDGEDLYDVLIADEFIMQHKSALILMNSGHDFLFVK